MLRGGRDPEEVDKNEEEQQGGEGKDCRPEKKDLFYQEQRDVPIDNTR